MTRASGYRPVSWWSRRSLQARITIVSTALFTIALILAGVVLVATIGRSLVNTLDSSAERTGNEIAVLVRENKLPQQVLAGSGGVSLVQVVDGQNRVIAASPGADTTVSVLTDSELPRARTGGPLTVSGERASVDSPLRVVGVRADIPAGQRTVLVATDLGRVLDSSRLLQRYLLLLGPLVIALMAVLTWMIVGRTLRPVEALRRGAADLSASGLSQSRLPVPAAHDEIYALANTLNDMLDRLDLSTTKQRRFVGDAAHELRSPIASLRVQLEVAGRIGESEELKELATDAMIDVDRLSNLIDDLLALARSDERGPSTPQLPFRLDELCATIVAEYDGARVPVSCGDSEAVNVNGDRDSVRRVLINLVDNAAKYARSAVEVSVCLEQHPDARPTDTAISTAPAAAGPTEWAVLVVADDGPGVPANKRERVFDRFYRVDTARSRADGGTGLGLAIVREIVNAHGGTVTLYDNEPGLRAVVRIPAWSANGRAGG